MLGQAMHEEHFRNHLAKYNTFVEFGSELVTFEQGEDFVTAQIKTANGVETVGCQWLFGSDGASSVTRRLLQIPFLGTTVEERGMVVGDVFVNWDIDRKVSTS